MTRSTVAVVALAMVLAATGVVALQAGAAVQPAAQAQSSHTGVQTQVAQPPEQGSFNVVSVSAPESAAPGENITVVAIIENPSTGTAAEAVEFRLGGDVVDRKRVAIDGNSVESVSFEVSTAGLDPGEYVHSIFTENDGVNQILTISESFTVSDLQAPANVTAGDTVVANATVANPNGFEATQRVTFRFGGAPLVDRQVTLGAGNSTTFTAEVDTTGVAPGTYAHGVFTRDAGQLARIDVEPPAEIPENASVAFSDQVANTTVTVDSVTVPQGGFVAIHDSSLLDGNVVGSVIGASEPLEPGTHENVTVQLFDVPGAEFDESELTENQSLIAMPHVDSNGNGVYDFVNSNGFADGPYRVNGSAVTDAANITVPQPEPTASVSISDQESDGTSVTVDSVTTSDGGFVVIHDASLLEGEVLGSVIGVSEPLAPGLNENVSVTLFQVPGGEFNETELTENQTLIAMPHLDTNGNGVYDFLTSNGTEDGPYTSNGSAVTDSANVTITQATEPPDNDTETPTDDGEETPTDDGEETPTDDGEGTPTDGGEETPTDGGEETPTDGGEETPTDGGEETPTDGGEETPTDGGEETPTDGSEETPADEGEGQ